MSNEPRAGSARRSRFARKPRAAQPPKTPAQAVLSMLYEIVIVAGTAIVLSLLIKTFLVQAFSIPSGSMEDTLLIGDRVLVSKLTPGPLELHRGDVVVFTDPGGWLPPSTSDDNLVRRGLTVIGLLPEDYGEHLIKRVIGLPGDTVACCDAQGHLTVNGVPVDEPYVRIGNAPSEEKFSVTVRPGQLWVMGDNRGLSEDSRAHRALNDGQVPVTHVVGKAFLVAWPLNRFGGVVDPPEVFADVPAATPSGTG